MCHDYSEFYKNALLYLAYTTVESLSEPFKQVLFAYLLFRHEKLDLMVAVSDSNNYLQNLAFDLSLVALLGDNIYNIRELLAHPIVCPYILIIYMYLSSFLSGYTLLLTPSLP